MRQPTDMPRRRARTPGRGRVFLIIAAVVLFVLFTSVRGIAEFWTDYLWFDSLGFSRVWTKTLAIKAELGALFTGVFFILLWVNLLIADRISPKFRPMGPDEELLNRYHQIIDRRAGTVRALVALVFAVITGASMSSQWNEWILFTNGSDFGTADPIFNVDVGFYMFRLPFLVTLVDWLFAAFVIILLITAAAHYLNGGIRLQSPFERVTPQVKAHLSVLLALLALVKAADYWLQRYQLTFSERGVVNGATYTEVNAQLPALYLLLVIALGSFVLFLVNIRRRGWVLPVIAVGLWAFVAVIVGEAYPAIYERVIVQPEQSTKEQTSITNNINATQQSYALDDQHVRRKELNATPDSQAAVQAVLSNPETVRNIQLLDPTLVKDTFQRLQSSNVPYQFATIDTDRYPMRLPNGDTAPTQVVIGNREMNSATIPRQTWEGTHLSYTHGYGFALAGGNALTTSGSPDFAVRDIPMVVTPPGVPINDAGPDARINLPVDHPEVYYGENVPVYSVVGTSAQEVDYIAKDSPVTKGYEGSGGVTLDSSLRRVAFALRFNDWNLVISDFINDNSRILYQRDIRDRLHTVAPFLDFDSDPYPVIADRHLVYVVDAYTTSEYYPNAQRYQSGVVGGDLGDHPFNYVRNSVKAVVDTYDGSIKLYIRDKTDPIIAAYQSAFPELFHDAAEMSSDLRSHLRYPQDIFAVQTEMWGRYHITDPKEFYDISKAWEVPLAPPTDPPTNTSPAAGAQTPIAAVATGSKTLMAPNYVLDRLPGEKPEFMVMRAFQPYSDNNSKNKLTAFMVGRSDPEDYGELDYYVTPADVVDGPSIVSSRMLNDPNVSRELTLFGQQGSKVQFGDLILVPVGPNTIIYVRSLYVVSQGQTQVPEVKRVIASFGDKVVMTPTLRDSLEALLPGSRPQTLEGATDQGTLPNPDQTNNGGTTTTTTPGSTAPPTSTPSGGTDAASLAAQINDTLKQADQALRNGDLGKYQQLVQDAQKKSDQLQQLLSPSTTTTTTTAVPGPSA